MQKFALLFLAVFSVLLGHVAPVEGVALVNRETNAERFARGLPPLSPNKREVAKRSKPSKRDPTPTLQERGHPSKRAFLPARDSKPKPSPVIKSRSKPSKRADSTFEKRSKPSKRADMTNEKRSKPSKRATPATVEKRSKPSKRASSVDVEKRSKPSKRATPVDVEKRSKPSKRATPVDVEKRSKPSKRAEPEPEVFVSPHWQMSSGRLEVRWACNRSIAGYVANNHNGGSFGLNDGKLPGENDLFVEYFDSTLMVMNPEFPPPYFVGGGDAESSVHDCSDKIRFGTVELGPSSAVWTLDPMSGALKATLINQDGSEDKPSLVYNPVQNVLSFTHHASHSSATEYPVYVYLSD